MKKKLELKWPNVMLVRHDVSDYNAMKKEREQTLLYRNFRAAFTRDWKSPVTKRLAIGIKNTFSLGVGDHNTPLREKLSNRAVETGKGLYDEGFPLPDVIFVSPYDRALGTLDGLITGWPKLADVKTYEEERVREQEHGLSILYNDWRVFHVLHPDQKELYEVQGRYWYRYPNGENVADVRLRNRQWLTTLTREFACKNVLVVTHHLTILAMRANLERLSAVEFIELDELDKPHNCGVTYYKGVPSKSGGKLQLSFYNRIFHKQS